MGRSIAKHWPVLVGSLVLLAVAFAATTRTWGASKRHRERPGLVVAEEIRVPVLTPASEERRTEPAQGAEVTEKTEARAILARYRMRMADARTEMAEESLAFARSMWLEYSQWNLKSLERVLGLSPAQKARMEELLARFEDEKALWSNHSADEAEVERKLGEVRDRYRDWIRAELSPDQREKYDGMSMELRYRFAVRDFDIERSRSQD